MKKTTLAIIITSAESFDAQRALMLPASGGSEVICSALSTVDSLRVSALKSRPWNFMKNKR